MKNELYSISKIFTERLLRIPDYQRGYAWTERQLKDYWIDIDQLEVGNNHYFGVLTLETVDKKKYNKWDDDLWIIESKSYEPNYVVDGQQRLTTTIILIQAIIESLDENKKLNYTSAEDIRKKFIFESKDNSKVTEVIPKQFCNELIDQQIRYNTNVQFGHIRDMIVQEAFKPVTK